MTISLVTGGAGFVGRHLVKALRDKGENVRVLDLAASDAADSIQGSITDIDAVSRAMDGVETVFHLAGDAQLWTADRSAFGEVNRRGTEVVLQAAAETGVQRFVHCSSLTTLVGRNTPLKPSTADESIRLQPSDMLGPYPKSKLLAEHAVEKAVKCGLDAVIVIPTEPLGSGDESLTPPTQMIVDFLNGANPAYIDCVLNFVPVQSLAEGFIAARQRGRRGARYLLGGENVSMRRLLDELEKISGCHMPKLKLPYAAAAIVGVIDTAIASTFTRRTPKAPLTGVRLAGRRVSFSSDKAERELGWRAAPFEPALAEAVQWLAEKGLLL